MVKTLARKCGHCGGTGRVTAAGAYVETIELIRNNPGLSGVALSKIAGCNPAAMWNRLTILERLGAVVGRRDGRQRFWSVRSAK